MCLDSGDSQSAEIWCITTHERGYRSGAKSPHSARDQWRQHLDSFEGEGTRSRERAIEDGDEKLELEHHLLGIKDGHNLLLRSPLSPDTTRQSALFVPDVSYT